MNTQYINCLQLYIICLKLNLEISKSVNILVTAESLVTKNYL
jgi:hypothetical protein